MDCLKFALFSLTVGLGILLARFRNEISYFTTLFAPGHSLDLVVMVLSARNNLLHRQTIRDTWGKVIKTNPELLNRVMLRFVVGNEACLIPLEDREDPFSCIPWRVSIPDEVGEFIAVAEANTTLENVINVSHNYGIHTIPFRVQHPVIFSKLGIHEDSISEKSSVKLLDAVSQREIVSTVFSKSSPGILVNGYRFKAVEPYLLPKGFEGLVVAENLIGSTTELPVTKRSISMRVDFGDGVLKFVRSELEYTIDGHYTDPKAWTSKHLWLPSFIFSIHEVDDLRNKLSNLTKRRMEWRHHISHETNLLQEESARHDDLFFADMVDVYRNIPQKLLKFFHWLTATHNFKYLLKTDDDCFIDLDRIISALDNLTTSENLWWGRFRNNWFVEHYGKWAEFDYKSIYYPRFACGSGYVITEHLTRWIAQNGDHLKSYQGEDVSMGIWLSAVGPEYNEDPSWQCEKECASNMYSMPELTPEEMQRIWADKTKCSDPCGCS